MCATLHSKQVESSDILCVKYLFQGQTRASKLYVNEVVSFCLVKLIFWFLNHRNNHMRFFIYKPDDCFWRGLVRLVFNLNSIDLSEIKTHNEHQKGKVHIFLAWYINPTVNICGIQ